MVKIKLLFVFLLLAGSLFAQEKTTLITGRLVKNIASLKELKPVDESKLVKAFDENGRRIWPKGILPPQPQVIKEVVPEGYADPLVQKNVPAVMPAVTNSVNTVNVSGIEAQASGVRVYDPTICVGSNHVIQLINGGAGAQMQIWLKDGTPVAGPISLQALSGLPGNGDPIALYDQLSDRYILTQFIIADGVSRPDGMVIMVSKTGDPTLGWFSYIWSIPERLLLDYPKWAVGPNGLFLHTNNFTNDYKNSFLVAFNKNELYSGNTSFRSLRITQNIGNAFSTCPAQLQGNAIPSGGQIFVAAFPTGSRGFNIVNLIECVANWSNNTLTQTNLGNFSVPGFTGNICGASEEACVAQPGSSIRVETLTRRVMNQPIMRILPNGSTGIVACFTVNAGNNTAGIRWMEFRKPASSWQVFQQGTWHPNSNHQFIPSIAYDAGGNIGLAYNTGSSNTFLGIRYTGRKFCDPLNQMTLPETSLREGSGVTDMSRWGDYNHLVADPNGQSLWMTAMYGQAAAPGQRGSYISNFTLPSCVAVCDAPATLNSAGITESGAFVSWSPVAGALSYTVEFKTSASSLFTTAGTTTATGLPLSGLTPGTVYDWRVRSNCSSGSSAFSQSQFVTATGGGGTCAVPAGLRSVTGCGEASLFWDAVPGALSYNVEFKRTTSTVWTLLEAGTPFTSSVIYATGGTYNWRVLANCAGSSSAFANSLATIRADSDPFCLQRIAKDNAVTEKKAVANGALKLSPQPANGRVTLSFEAAQKGSGQITVTNALGVAVSQKSIAVLQGANVQQYDISSLSPGVYVVRLRTGNQVKKEKLIIQ
jgi:hypothetical protein